MYNPTYTYKLRKRNILIFLLIYFVSIGYSQINFAPYQVYPTGSSSEVVRIGDVNNDGLKDVVLGLGYNFDEINDYHIFVYLQDNFGNLLPPVKYAYSPLFPGLNAISINDVNSDGLKDVVITFGESIGIFYQNAIGALNSMQIYGGGCTNCNLYGMNTGDLNNDGLIDIVASNQGANTISVLYQNNTGDFDILSYPAPPSGLNHIEVADINNDQLNDVVLMMGRIQDGVIMYKQNTSCTLDTYQSYSLQNLFLEILFLGITGIDIGNLNFNGLNDIAESVYANSPNSKIAMLFQDSITGFSQVPPYIINAYDCPQTIRITDFNCDGRNEIIVAHGGWDALSVFEQNTINRYDSYKLFPLPYASNYESQGMDVGDINNDGKADVVIADYNHGLVVLINQSTPSKPESPLGESLICESGLTSVYKTPDGSTNSITWNLFPPEAGTIISSNRDSCIVLWNDNWQGVGGIYLTATNDCGNSNSEILYISSSRLPSINLGNDTILCENSRLELEAGDGFLGYRWQENTISSTYLVDTGGTYYVQAQHICGTSFDTINITEIPLTEINLSDTSFCSGTSIQLDISHTGISSYTWQDNSTNPVYSISSPGIYSVLVTDINNCQNSKSIVVNELSIPTVYLPADTTFCDSVNLTLDVSYSGASYRWQDGSTLAQYEVKTSGTYTVSLTNMCGTETENTHVILENCNVYLDVPSAFSPNSDGINDVLYAVGTNVEKINFVIYNRWGQVVFESKDISKGWDGTFEGKLLNTAVFVYTISAISTTTGQTIQKRGNVSLIR